MELNNKVAKQLEKVSKLFYLIVRRNIWVQSSINSWLIIVSYLKYMKGTTCCDRNRLTWSMLEFDQQSLEDL